MSNFFTMNGRNPSEIVSKNLVTWKQLKKRSLAPCLPFIKLLRTHLAPKHVNVVLLLLLLQQLMSNSERRVLGRVVSFSFSLQYIHGKKGGKRKIRHIKRIERERIKLLLKTALTCIALLLLLQQQLHCNS